MGEYEEDEVSLGSDDLELPPLRIPSMRDSNLSSIRQDSGLTASGRLMGGFMSPPMSMKQRIMRKSVAIFDDKGIQEGYASVPLIEHDMLPRGGMSFETKAVGRIQFGIPPETIKDSMNLGMDVPRVYIVPVERFCREQGPSLGVNLAEFEFPAYFTYFVRQFKCTLVVDSPLAESEIRSVFGETLLGPAHFRDHKAPLASVDEDFDPSFPRERRPNFYKELGQFRANEKTNDYEELEIDTLLDFIHFKSCRKDAPHQDNMLGVPPDAKLVQFGNGSIHIGNDSIRFGNDSIAAGDSLLQSPLMSPNSGSKRRDSNGNEKPKVNASDDRLGELNTIVSLSSASESSARQHIGRRGSLTSLVEASENSSTMHSSFGRLQRSNSDGSLSKLSQGSSNSSAVRRGSMGSFGERPQSERLLSMETTRASWVAPKEKLFMHASQRIEKPLSNIKTSAPRRRDSTFTSAYSSRASTKVSGVSSVDSYDFMMDDDPDQGSNWMYSQAKWLGDVATVFPADATEEEKREKTCPRVEIFKMAGGTEYIVHDVDKDNIIIGKTRFSGNVYIPDELELAGFISNTKNSEDDDYADYMEEPEQNIPPVPKQKTFHPPSFGVTVLGNSHGFDKNGTTSGYVLWVNGRGIMVDPPPYSNATLEREGIRPQMIMGIIITHCHADHDAGAFQKVMRGSRVAIITTPTIYDSFIRKYSALSGLKPSLLRHSHRHRPAIIGQPLRFQGAIFHFTYTLHTIPCISFRAEWRGKSIVFTGDHMNIPDEIKKLETKGVLSKSRAEDLLRLPLQKCDVLLHEAGAPPIHTPLDVLRKLPQNIRERLYVVHTAAIPPNCGLKVAPTGTAGTIRLDSAYGPSRSVLAALGKAPSVGGPARSLLTQTSTATNGGNSSSAHSMRRPNTTRNGRNKVPPLVFLRPTDVSDAWFILNLLSAVPFLSSLSYGHTMEFLEIAHVEMYCQGEVVIQSSRRSESLCVFWEGVCSEKIGDTVWHAGDWTGPPPFETDQTLHNQGIEKSVHSRRSANDIIAISEEGVKVITLPMKDVRKILKSGSKLFRKYLSLQHRHEGDLEFHMGMNANSMPQEHSVLELVQCNSVLRNLNANQRITLQSLAEGPRYFAINAPLWQSGDPVEYAMIIVEGTATIGTAERRRSMSFSRRNRRGSTGGMAPMTSISEQSQAAQLKPIVTVEPDKKLQNVNRNSEYYRLLECLQERADEYDIDEELESEEEEDKSVADRASNDKAAIAMKEQRDKFANKVLARLYSRQAYTENLVFSRGCFLCDTSRMISGDLATINKSMGGRSSSIASGGSSNDHHCHTSTMLAGKQGCVAMVFPKSSLMPFLDANPGLLLSLLGTKVLV